jgi:hypothetical protein
LYLTGKNNLKINDLQQSRDWQLNAKKDSGMLCGMGWQ